ncbi:MAG TPA: hypothetical protein VGI22_11760 [Xanthobacteraceae bacterium]
MAGLHHEAALPKYSPQTFEAQARAEVPEIDRAAPARLRPQGRALREVLHQLQHARRRHGRARGAGAQRRPHCYGMPMLEQGRLEEVANGARLVAAELRPWIDKGYAVIALVPSCALMLKFEWPLIVTDDNDVK